MNALQNLSFSPQPHDTFITKEGRKFVQFDVSAHFRNSSTKAMNLAVKQPDERSPLERVSAPTVDMHSYIAGTISRNLLAISDKAWAKPTYFFEEVDCKMVELSVKSPTVFLQSL